MSVGPLGGIVGSAAGAPLSQTKGSEVDRAGQESTAQERKVEGEKSAEKASGIGQTEEDQESSDRDADGRRLWEVDEQEQGAEEDAEGKDDQAGERKAKDPTGQSGNTLDLTG